MPFLKCNGCGEILDINVGPAHIYNQPNTECNPKKLIGSAICKKCKTGTGFEIADNVLIYVSSKSGYGSINTGLSGKVKILYAEAELCYQNGAPNASAAMCRAATEMALVEAGFEGETLYKLIDRAKEKGRLDEVEVGLAHSSRLLTRGAIHRGEFVSLADLPSILSATVKILNKLSNSVNQ